MHDWNSSHLALRLDMSIPFDYTVDFGDISSFFSSSDVQRIGALPVDFSIIFFIIDVLDNNSDVIIR